MGKSTSVIIIVNSKVIQHVNCQFSTINNLNQKENKTKTNKTNKQSDKRKNPRKNPPEKNRKKTEEKEP